MPTTFALSRSEALDFLSSFGENTEDLLVEVKSGRLTGAVGFDTFYFRKTHIFEKFKTAPPLVSGILSYREGVMGITDLKKVMQFCKKCNAKAGVITFHQNELGKQLTVKCGGMTLKVPTMKTINSYTKVPTIEKGLSKTEKNMFTQWKKSEIETHGVINVGNLKSISGFKNFFTYPDFLISTHVEEGEFFIKAGKQGTMQLTIDTELTEASGSNKRVQSKFGKWLMECTSLLSDGDAWIHMGENTFLFVQQENSFLIVKNEA
jgi:hypothetical protein